MRANLDSRADDGSNLLPSQETPFSDHGWTHVERCRNAQVRNNRKSIGQKIAGAIIEGEGDPGPDILPPSDLFQRLVHGDDRARGCNLIHLQSELPWSDGKWILGVSGHAVIGEDPQAGREAPPPAHSSEKASVSERPPRPALEPALGRRRPDAHGPHPNRLLTALARKSGLPMM